MAEATGGLAGARVVSAVGEPQMGQTLRTAEEFHLLYVLNGSVRLEGAGEDAIALEPDDCVALPAGLDLALVAGSPNLELLEIRLPG
ncbi:MAG: putative cupin superfamily protein [Planctomycetota bacterium]